ncbi:ESX secretion-associated protein EspG [Gordonia insulae]|uniref:ESX-3 secretion-associated protein EspG3 n=1 Tax=Gordonia insulae TaxID=2420509 RepID=A0A3G8JW79_9ACTN|nr:ESX secretion-associated protein EspG [Gordonia insulae]AZG48440.1 ESX-3 secretion-associated protein EspG3 [Gordonia insulae]
MWSVTAEPATVLGVPELLRLGELVGVQTWPVVLDLWRTHDDADELNAVAAAADREIHGRGLMEGGEPSAWVAAALRVLSAPERQLEIRIVSDADADADGDGDGDGAAGDGRRAPETVRICLARNGHDHVIARREGGQIGLRHLDVAAESELGAIVAREFPPADGATFGGFSAPADELAARLATCVSSNDVADALHALGATSSDAVALAAGLTSAHARSEIVAVSWTGGTSTQSSGALAIFDTDRGRIVASPSKSPDGRVWTTLSPGSGHRIGQAVGLLIETLPEGRWMP